MMPGDILVMEVVISKKYKKLGVVTGIMMVELNDM